MKKFVVLLLVVCVVFAAVMSYLVYVPNPIAATASEEAAGVEVVEAPAAPAAEPVQIQPAKASAGLDYEAIKALYPEDQVVVKVDDEDMTWGEYSEWLLYVARQVEMDFAEMQNYYGITVGWNDMATDDMNYSQYVVAYTEDLLGEVCALEDYAEDIGYVMGEEDEAALDEIKRQEMLMYVGDVDEEAYHELMKKYNITPNLYDELNEVYYLYDKLYTEKYGENGEDIDAAEVLAWLEENEYITANHILLLSVDANTNMPLDEASVAAAREQAEALVAELNAIEDIEARIARFVELKAEYCADPGAATFPEGYTFNMGTMVSEFETACAALEVNQISDVVETSYGFHVIMRLAPAADSLILYSDNTATTAASAYTSSLYNSVIAEKMTQHSFEYLEGYTPVDFSKYIKE